MKKYLLILTLALNAAAADYDLIKGIDLTGITGGPTYSQLNQLVDNGIINTNNKGIIFVTAGNTNPTATPFGRQGMTNYLWLDRTTDPAYLKAWSYAAYVASGGANGWVNVAQVTIAVNSIDHTMLQTAAVWTTNILDASITQAKIPAGTYNQGFLADGAISSNKIAQYGIVSSNIAPLAITAALIATNTITSNQVALGGLSWTNMQGAMPSNWLGEDAVNSSKVLDRSLINTDIATNTVTSNEVAIAGLSYTNFNAQVKAGLSFASAKFRGTDGACYASNNVASITRISPGYYTLTFNVNASSTNYNIYGSADSPGVNLAYSIKMTNHPSVSSFNFIIHNTSAASATGDATNVMINVFGGY